MSCNAERGNPLSAVAVDTACGCKRDAVSQHVVERFWLFFLKTAGPETSTYGEKAAYQSFEGCGTIFNLGIF